MIEGKQNHVSITFPVDIAKLIPRVGGKSGKRSARGEGGGSVRCLLLCFLLGVVIGLVFVALYHCSVILVFVVDIIACSGLVVILLLLFVVAVSHR